MAKYVELIPQHVEMIPKHVEMIPQNGEITQARMTAALLLNRF